MTDRQLIKQLQAELDESNARLSEATEAIEAIRMGMVDALIVESTSGHQLYTLTNADQTFRLLVEKMHQGAVTVNKDGVILYSNSKFATMTGLPLEQVIGKDIDTFFSGYSSSLFQQIITHGHFLDHSTEDLICCANSTPTPVMLSITNLDLPDGTALSILVSDLTESKTAEKVLVDKNIELEKAKNNALQLNNQLEEKVVTRTQELKTSQEHFILLADNVPQVTWTNLPDGSFDFFNQRWADLAPLKPGSSYTEIWAQVIHPDDLAHTISRFENSISSAEIFEMENRYRKADGTYRWHLNRCVPLKSEGGGILFWIGTATDIDDQRKLLEKKEEFMSIASHELKTPLTSLKAYLQLMMAYKKDDIPAQIKNYIGKAESAASKLQILVNDLLDVSKIQAGKLHFDTMQIEVTNFIQNCVQNARYMYPEYEIALTVADECMIKGNAERLEQVVMNLINNAVKYSPENKDIAVSVNLVAEQVKISIEDHGIGLSEFQQKRIFDRFYRVDEKNYSVGGLGMGLYISTEIIAGHHGKMTVSSQLGKGSTFSVLLPLLPSSAVSA